MTVRILTGDCRELLAGLDAESVQMCVTSPPYFALRNYNADGQIGIEPTWPEYVAQLVVVFREVHRVLRNDGTLWLNLGDCYATGGGSVGAAPGGGKQGESWKMRGLMTPPNRMPQPGLKSKDLMLIPARVAIALQEDGWYVRSDIVWSKPNPMPESIRDRPTKSHEFIFLLSKSERYFYDGDAIAEPAVTADEIEWAGDTSLEQGKANSTGVSTRRFKKGRAGNTVRRLADGREGERPADHRGSSIPWEGVTRNKRTVWTVKTKPYKGAHFATFPPALIEPCILAGSRRGDLVLDPFGGAGTTGLVADRLGRSAILCELNPEYAAMARKRIDDAAAHGYQEGLDLSPAVGE